MIWSGYETSNMKFQGTGNALVGLELSCVPTFLYITLHQLYFLSIETPAGWLQISWRAARSRERVSRTTRSGPSATLPDQLGVYFASIAQGDMEVKQQPSIFEMAWPTQDNHLLLSIVMTTLVLLCGNWMSLACTFIAMILSCSALYDDITGYSGLPKAKVSLLLNMVALLLMAAMWYQVLLSNESRQKHCSESSPTFSPVILSEPKTLPEFIKKYSDSLPRTALVTTGYLDDNSTLEISCYEILRIDSLHTVSVVLATNAKKEPLPPIPMTEEMRFSLLYDPNNNTAEAIKGFVFSGVRNLLSTVQLPKVVCAVDDWNGDFVAISRGEILVFNEKCLPRRSNATSGLVTFSVSKMVDKFLPKECTGNFSTDPMLIQMSLQNMIAHITNPFPCKVYTPLQRAVLTLVGSDIIQNVNFSLFDICRGEFVPSMMQLTLNQTVIELALIDDPSSTIQSSVALPKKQPVCG
ncbi:hypothetical protein EMCRGX_G022969 [Ephydatia muelleri]